MLKKLREKVESWDWVKRNRWLIGALYRAALIVIYMSFFQSVARRIEDFQIFIQRPDGVTLLTQLLGAAGLCLLGVALFAVRYFWREQYGYLEITSAMVFSFFAVGKVLSTDPGKTNEIGIGIVTMAGCVYLVVRGLDNIMQVHNENLDKEFEPRFREIEDRRIELLIEKKIHEAQGAAV